MGWFNGKISARKKEKIRYANGFNDVLELAKTPEERAQMKKRLLSMIFDDKDDDEIDLSDMPEITDFSNFKPLKPRLDAMREHNRQIYLKLKHQQALQ